jgi:hypothetical protein
MELTFVVDERTETQENGLKLVLRHVDPKITYLSNLYLDAKAHPDLQMMQVGERYRVRFELVSAVETVEHTIEEAEKRSGELEASL